MAVVSYFVEVVNNTKELRTIVANTVDIYNSALNYVIGVVEDNYQDISPLDNLGGRMYLEHLIHNTKNNKAKYDFDKMFYKMPCYMLRDIESRAIGHYSSYISNLTNYKKERYESMSSGLKYKKKEPTKALCNALPTFYKNNMFVQTSENMIELKMYVDNTWKYVKLKLKQRDIKYINKLNGKMLNPEISIKGNKIYVKFIFKVKSLSLSRKSINEQIVCGVDLGINNDATLSIMDSNGTIIGRHFVKTREKDHLNHLLNRKRKIQRESGNYKYLGNLHIVNKINSLNTNMVNHTASEIIKICLSYGVDVIVFENLHHRFKRAKKSYRQRFHHWRKIAIFNKAYEMAHRNGMRISTVNPCGTSMYAYDGSGEVKRDKNNYSLCTFTNGKTYNCDLSASYNIAARYLVREYTKPLDENSRSILETKASIVLSGTKVTYSSLKGLINVI